MSTLWCLECSVQESGRWYEVAESRWLCQSCAQTVRDVFGLAAYLEISGVELLMRVCEVDS